MVILLKKTFLTQTWWKFSVPIVSIPSELETNEIHIKFSMTTVYKWFKFSGLWNSYNIRFSLLLYSTEHILLVPSWRLIVIIIKLYFLSLYTLHTLKCVVCFLLPIFHWKLEGLVGSKKSLLYIINLKKCWSFFFCTILIIIILSTISLYTYLYIFKMYILLVLTKGFYLFM